MHMTPTVLAEHTKKTLGGMKDREVAMLAEGPKGDWVAREARAEMDRRRVAQHLSDPEGD